jgi:hypothetical protein
MTFSVEAIYLIRFIVEIGIDGIISWRTVYHVNAMDSLFFNAALFQVPDEMVVLHHSRVGYLNEEVLVVYEADGTERFVCVFEHLCVTLFIKS